MGLAAYGQHDEKVIYVHRLGQGYTLNRQEGF